MNISTRMIVSNSDMIKNFKNCREKAESLGKVFILKNNQPDSVLFSIKEYQRVSAFMEYLEKLDDEEIKKFAKLLPEAGHRKYYSIDQLKSDLEKAE